MSIHTYGLKPVNTGINNIFDELFNSSFSDLVSADFVSTKPSVNIEEAADAYTIALAAPGLDKSDFNVEVDKDQLIISAEIKSETEEESDDKSFTKREFNYRSFKRSFRLTDKVNADGIDASYTDGILNVKVPKAEAAIEKAPTVIDIQ